jgi:hypothetical protein
MLSPPTSDTFAGCDKEKVSGIVEHEVVRLNKRSDTGFSGLVTLVSGLAVLACFKFKCKVEKKTEEKKRLTLVVLHSISSTVQHEKKKSHLFILLLLLLLLIVFICVSLETKVTLRRNTIRKRRSEKLDISDRNKRCQVRVNLHKLLGFISCINVKNQVEVCLRWRFQRDSYLRSRDNGQ